jgi:hypothetical protein
LKQTDLLHDINVTREVAKQLLENYKDENGYFLVRRTQRDHSILVLSLMCNGEFFNYEICAKDFTLSQRFYFIDDGPYFRSLAHLIEHYTKYEDGLPGILTRAIPTGIFNSTQSRPSSSNGGNSKHFLNIPNSSSSSSSLSSGSLSKLSSNDKGCRNDGTLNTSKSEALTRANLFKSRTLLNDQSKSRFFPFFLNT